ncbi:MAG: OmpA family protein [Woeseiaceae bacterium]
MSSEFEQISTTTRSKSERRYWRLADTPRSWWPWGFVPAAGLAFLFLFGALFTAPRIEAEVRGQVASRFDGAGHFASEVASDGQGVVVHAEALGHDTVYLQALAKSTQCDTWAGQLTCPTSANVVVKQAEAAPAVPAQRPHPFSAVRTENTVTLSGEVPNLEERDRILGVAGQHFDMVTDELIVSNDPSTKNDSHAADVSIALVNNLSSGTASWSGHVLTVTGMASAGAVATTRAEFDAFGSGPMLGDFDVHAVNEMESCNERFSSILNNATVRFETNSATIDQGNEALLEQLAALAHSCPGSLTVEGHTDSRGDAEMNKALSLARASAVRDALAGLGVDTDRVTATGFGAAQPIADNATADGRARNRRIAIIVDETN